MNDAAESYASALLASLDALQEAPAIQPTQMLRFCLALQQSLLPLLEKPELQPSAARLIARLAARGHDTFVQREAAAQTVAIETAERIGRLLGENDRLDRQARDLE